MLRDHEKLWAFLALVGSIVFLAWLGRGVSVSDGGQGLTIRDAIIGLIGIAGAAGQALFRVSSVDQKNAETAGVLAKTASDFQADNGPPKQVEVVNTPDAPVPTTSDGAAGSGELPEEQKL